MNDKEKLEVLQRYCPGDFARSVCYQYEQKGFLTKKQWSTVDRLISQKVADDDYRDLSWDSFGDGYDV